MEEKTYFPIHCLSAGMMLVHPFGKRLENSTSCRAFVGLGGGVAFVGDVLTIGSEADGDKFLDTFESFDSVGEATNLVGVVSKATDVVGKAIGGDDDKEDCSVCF